MQRRDSLRTTVRGRGKERARTTGKTSAYPAGGGRGAARLTAEDGLGIMDLAARYWVTVDFDDVAGYAELFTEDGVLENDEGVFDGREAIGRWLEGYMPVERGNRPHELNHFITADGTARHGTARHGCSATCSSPPSGTTPRPILSRT